MTCAFLKCTIVIPWSQVTRALCESHWSDTESVNLMYLTLEKWKKPILCQWNLYLSCWVWHGKWHHSWRVVVSCCQRFVFLSTSQKDPYILDRWHKGSEIVLLIVSGCRQFPTGIPYFRFPYFHRPIRLRSRPPLCVWCACFVSEMIMVALGIRERISFLVRVILGFFKESHFLKFLQPW